LLPGAQTDRVLLPVFKPMDKSIRDNHQKFLDDLMAHPKKRRDFMRGIKELRMDRINRLKRSKTCRYELSNQCKLNEISSQIAYDDRRKQVLKKKNENWKLRLFTVYKREITSELKDNLESIRSDIFRNRLRNRFFFKFMYLVKYLRTVQKKYMSERKIWIESVRKHLASRKIAIHWKRYIYKRGEVVVVRTIMNMRHSFKYKIQCLSYQPSFSGNVLWPFYDFLRK